MKTLTYSSNKEEVESLLSNIMNYGHKVTLWQVPLDFGPRIVQTSKLLSINPESSLFFSVDRSAKSFSSGTVYFYCKECELIFKSELLDHNEQYSLSFPQEMKSLGSDDQQIMSDLDAMSSGSFESSEGSYSVSGSSETITSSHNVMVGKISGTEKLGPDIVKKDLSHAVVTKYEDKVWASHREAPRKKIEGERRVTLKKVGDDEPVQYSLFDLSQGGMSFIVKNKDLFVKDDLLEVLFLDKKELEPPLQGKVASVRPMQDAFEFKVGVMFLG